LGFGTGANSGLKYEQTIAQDGSPGELHGTGEISPVGE